MQRELGTVVPAAHGQHRQYRGGGNFDVVTGMEIDLVPVAIVPDEMTSAVAMIPLPGKHVAQLQISYAGRRLTELKARLDPHGMFQANHPIG